MTTNNFYGDQVTQYGDHNIGIIKSQVLVDPQVALGELWNALSDLRAHVSASDQEIIGEAAEIIRQGQQADKEALNRRLGKLIGIATLAGAVGGPVIDAALKVKQLFGL